MRLSRRVWAMILPVGLGLLATFESPAQGQTRAVKGRKVQKTDAQWAKLLTVEQYLVTRRKATEPAFSGKYFANHARGTYLCVCCGAALFNSTAKFDSGTGWPSFWRPIDPKRLETAPDYHEAEPRVEVMCTDCGAHLGHVFSDGPPPTGLRFCINSLALKFRPVGSPASKSSSTSKSKDKPPAKETTKGEPEEPAPPGAEPARESRESPSESR